MRTRPVTWLGPEGFTLIEVLLAVGMGMLVIAGLMQGLSISNGQAKNARFMSSLEDISASLMAVMANPDRCARLLVSAGANVNTLTGSPTAPGISPVRFFDYLNLNDATRTVLIAKDGGDTKWYNFVFKQLRIEPATIADSQHPGQTLLFGNVRMAAEKDEATGPNVQHSSGGSRFERVFPITVSYLNDMTIVGCSSTNPTTLDPVALPTCVPGQMLTLDATHVWTCMNIDGPP